MTIVTVLIIIFATFVVAVSVAVIVKCIHSSHVEFQMLQREREHENLRIQKLNFEELQILQSIKSLQRQAVTDLDHAKKGKQSVTKPGNPYQDVKIAVACSGFYKELSRSLKHSETQTIGALIHKDVNEELVKLESATIALHQAKSEREQQVDGARAVSTPSPRV